MLVLPLRLAAFAAVLLFLLQAGEAEAYGGNFNPTAEVTLSNYDACAPANVTSLFQVPAGDMNFQVNVTFTPEEWGMQDPDTPIGAKVGELQSNATIGLFGGPCYQSLSLLFKLYNATVDTSDELARADLPNEPQDSAAWDLDGNGILDGADQYPEWLNDPKLFQGLQPIARSVALNDTVVPGTNIVLQFVVFAPGTCLPNAPCPPPAGYPSVTVLQDPTTVAPSGITDFCSPLRSENTTYGLSQDNPATPEDESGYVARRNPIEDGTYTFRTYARSYWNADDDDYENYLDTCPFDVNLEDPTTSSGPDADAFDTICDPAPAVMSPLAGSECGGSGLPDYDGDCYADPGDNCPSVANGITNDGTIRGPNNQADADLDYIGDACDPSPNTPDGGTLDTTEEAPVDIDEVDDCDDDGMPNTYELEHDCLDVLVDDADADPDGDDVSNIDEMDADTDPCVAEAVIEETPTPTPEASPTPTPTPTPTVEDADGDTVPDDIDNCPDDSNPDQADLDGDGEGDVCDDDVDGDDLSNDAEELFGSDPDDADSTPESLGFDPDTCTDGVDNDGDGLVDADDEGCVDVDADVFEDVLETKLGSDSDDPESMPEHVTIEGTCTDGIDNDGDGLIDAEDPGCAVGTPTPTVEVDICEPKFPGLYNGRVLLDGSLAAAGWEVTAWVNDVEWASTIVSGGRYAMDIPDRLAVDTCFEAGTITFKLDGMTCEPSPEWAAGLQDDVDLTCVSAEVEPTPTPPVEPTPTPPVEPTPTPTVLPPTGMGGMSGDGSFMWWPLALAAAALTSAAGLGALVAAKRR